MKDIRNVALGVFMGLLLSIVVILSTDKGNDNQIRNNNEAFKCFIK